MGFKIMVTGGKGHLAQELVRIDPSIDAPGREELDVREFESIERYCRGKEYDVVVHAAAVTNKFNEDADEAYIRSNIIGTSNIVLWAMRHKVRLVYISSDYDDAAQGPSRLHLLGLCLSIREGRVHRGIGVVPRQPLLPVEAGRRDGGSALR